ncbi:MAG: phosphate signaling complex protein PhoU [Candidatus Omnitrophica bacterium]|nr:phosphate signaling complex protein PhoU [Candidatus Omnitrophota bacterium]
MERHFHEDLKELKQRLLRMGLLVEETVEKAIQALLKRDSILANQVVAGDKVINQLEIEIDEMGHSLIALGQPMAVDLRVVTSILKINTDLERMGDHAVNIAERSLIVMKEPVLKTHIHLPEMAQAALKMLKDALDAFVNGDVELARSVLKRDDEVDDYNDEIYQQIVELMQKDPSIVKTGMSLIIIGHNLERIADLANNIAEDVIYMKQGKEVRHHIETQQ